MPSILDDQRLNTNGVCNSNSMPHIKCGPTYFRCAIRNTSYERVDEGGLVASKTIPQTQMRGIVLVTHMMIYMESHMIPHQ